MDLLKDKLSLGLGNRTKALDAFLKRSGYLVLLRYQLKAGTIAFVLNVDKTMKPY